MIATNGILIRNIFHMLAYAYKGLRHKSYERIAIESFDHIEDLMAAILLRGINQQVKQGLHRDYQLHSDDLLTVRGRIVLAGVLSADGKSTASTMSSPSIISSTES